MVRADLHLHSTASDGRFSPSDVIRMAADASLDVIALTDHDTVGGIPEAVESSHHFPQMRFIPGVEISTDVPNGEVHVLGYFIDYEDPGLEAALSRMRNSRWERARKMVARLGEMGYPIDIDRVKEISSEGAVGRPHIAQALLERGHVSSFKESFDRFIGRNGPAYVERDKLTPSEAVHLVLDAAGVPVLAHPLTVPDPETVAAGLKKAGLAGLEAYYAGYPRADVVRLVRLARRLGLIATGGTDFHGLDPEAEPTVSGIDIPLTSVENLLRLAPQPEPASQPGPEPANR